MFFDGVDDNINCSTLLQQYFTGTTPYTIEIWANQTTRQSGYRMPASNENTIAIGRDGANLTIYSSSTTNTQITHERFGSNVQVNSSINVPYQINVGAPFHMVGTYDGNNVKVYINSSGSTSQVSTSPITNTATSFRLGSRGSGSGNFFNGEIYVTRIYNRALSSSEILQNFNAQKSRFGL
jgi:predicted heme/steroid binding protein